VQQLGDGADPDALVSLGRVEALACSRFAMALARWPWSASWRTRSRSYG
jgi:hypothetical protein